MCDSCMQPPKDPKYLNGEHYERLARQEEVDRMEKQLHEYYGVQKEISRDQLIVRIQQFHDYIVFINQNFIEIEDREKADLTSEFINQHSYLFRDILSDFDL